MAALLKSTLILYQKTRFLAALLKSTLILYQKTRFLARSVNLSNFSFYLSKDVLRF